MKSKKTEERNPWLWGPSLYLAEGLPLYLVSFVTTVMYQNLGISNTEIAFYTSILYLPWVIKPFWSPLVDNLKTKRFWVIIMQFTITLGLVGIVLSLNTSAYFLISIFIFYIIAFSSATHDIAADGFYMLGLNQHDQSFFVGVRSTFYRFAKLLIQGGLVVLAGILINYTENPFEGWMISFSVAAIVFAALASYHKRILPFPVLDDNRMKNTVSELVKSFTETFRTFLKKKQIVVVLLFILFYRFAEAQIDKIAVLFLLDDSMSGGLGLNNESIGFVYGTVGVIALSLGGILGGIAASKRGLKFWIWWMLIAINLPDLVYVYLAATQTSNFILINICVAVEQFGYGFGFTAFMLYLIYISDGEYKTAHYAIATGLMALGMMLPGMISGWIQEEIGYLNFFIWVCISTIPAFVITKLLKIDPEFGKKK